MLPPWVAVPIPLVSDEEDDDAVVGAELAVAAEVVVLVVALLALVLVLVVGATVAVDVELVARAELVTPAMSVPARVAPAAATPAAAMLALRSTGLRRSRRWSGGGVVFIPTTIAGPGSAACHATVKVTSSPGERILCRPPYPT